MKFDLISIAKKAKHKTIAILVAQYVAELDSHVSVMLYREGSVPLALLEGTSLCGDALFTEGGLLVDESVVVPGWRVSRPKLIGSPAKVAEIIEDKIITLVEKVIDAAHDSARAERQKVLASGGIVL